MDENNSVGNDTGNDSSPPSSDAGSGNSSPSWWIDENTPGTGNRPEWLPEKFKNVKGALQSLSELEKKLGAPPVNDYDFGDHAEDFDKEHEAIKDLQAFAKEKRVPQEVFSKMLESMSKYGNSFIPNPDAEMAKLGDNGKQRVEVLNNFVKANFSEATANALFASMGTAESVKAMEEVKNKMIGNNQIPNGSDNATPSGESVQDLQDELAQPGNYQKFQTDVKYRADWQRRLGNATKNMPE